MEWFSTNITSIIERIWDIFLNVVNNTLIVIFNVLDACVAALPSGDFMTPLTNPGSANPVWSFMLQSLNYFFDMDTMIVTLGVGIALHLAVIVPVGIMRFFQVMK